MYVRARPTIDLPFISNLLKLKIIPKAHYDDNVLFFNSGRGALKWFLQNISETPLRVGVQAFTCSTVIDAINEVNYKVVFIDTNENYFTTLMHDLWGYEYVDVLVLTHLFGIPNPDYLEIKKWANNNNIIIIDDLAQTIKSKINGELLENLSEYYFCSFSFDKPLSAGGGGLLKIDSPDIFNLKEKYKQLTKQSEKTGKQYLKKFVFYYKLTSNKFYKKEFRTNSLIEKIFFHILPIKSNYFAVLTIVLSSRLNFYLSYIETKITKKLKIIPLQLSDTMICYIQEILHRELTNRQETIVLAKKKLKEIDENIIFPDNKNLTIAYGLRFPVLSDKSDYVIDRLLAKGIECGKHNWPHLVTEKIEDYPNSKNIVDKIVNIPIWSSEIWERFYE